MANAHFSIKELELTWEKYFAREGVTFFQRLLMVHRRVFISRAMRFWFDEVFPDAGVYVEAGSGTSESSSRIDRSDRCLVALDVCFYVLQKLNVLPNKTQGDISCLPFADHSLDGIWNLGVMEHFTDEQVDEVLREFRRVLKPEGALLLLWPPWFAPYEIVLNTFAWFLITFFRKKIEFFPDEINRFTTRSRLDGLLNKAGFRLRRATFSWRDLYSYIVVVADVRK